MLLAYMRVMKEIPNVLFTAAVAATASTKEVPAETTVSFLRLSLDILPPGGAFTPALMRARNRVEDATNGVEVGGTIKLEDTDYATAQEAVKGVSWGRRDRNILKFVELFGL